MESARWVKQGVVSQRGGFEVYQILLRSLNSANSGCVGAHTNCPAAPCESSKSAPSWWKRKQLLRSHSRGLGSYHCLLACKMCNKGCNVGLLPSPTQN